MGALELSGTVTVNSVFGFRFYMAGCLPPIAIFLYLPTTDSLQFLLKTRLTTEYHGTWTDVDMYSNFCIPCNIVEL